MLPSGDKYQYPPVLIQLLKSNWTTPCLELLPVLACLGTERWLMLIDWLFAFFWHDARFIVVQFVENHQFPLVKKHNASSFFAFSSHLSIQSAGVKPPARACCTTQRSLISSLALPVPLARIFSRVSNEFFSCCRLAGSQRSIIAVAEHLVSGRAAQIRYSRFSFVLLGYILASCQR